MKFTLIVHETGVRVICTSEHRDPLIKEFDNEQEAKHFIEDAIVIEHMMEHMMGEVISMCFPAWRATVKKVGLNIDLMKYYAKKY